MRRRPPEPIFKRNLFSGTAADYDRFRLEYPAELGEWLRDELALDGSGLLLDLGAGTGHVARLLRPYFAGVIAVDAEPDMVEFGRATYGEGIDWRLGNAEDLEFPEASLDVVSAGNAFHRFDRPVVAGKAARWLKPRGAVALLWSRPMQLGDAPWQRALAPVIDEWTKSSDRVPAGWERVDYRDDAVLRDAGFTRIDTHRVDVRHRWTLDEVLGLFRSTSFASRAALGDRSEIFEDAVRRALLDVDDSGVYEQDADFAALVARR